MKAFAPGLLGRLLLIVSATAALQFAVSAYLYERASQFSLREDEAERLADRFVIARNVLQRAAPSERPKVAQSLAAGRDEAVWSETPPLPHGSAPHLANLESQVLDADPSLAETGLRLWLAPLSQGAAIEADLRVADGWLALRVPAPRSGWRLTAERMAAALLPAATLLVLAMALIRLALRPLRRLVDALGAVGGEAASVPLAETGAAEIRALIHAFNAMRGRIHDLIERRTQALAAAGHDLRTPLARLQFRVENLKDPRERAAMAADVAEMEAMIASLLAFLSGDETPEPRIAVDVATLAATLVDAAQDRGADAHYFGPDHCETPARPAMLKRALGNLVDNALAYGGAARVRLEPRAGGVVIRVCDDGPGIPEHRLADVIKPFVRLDESRGRNTAGMGLGLAIAAEAARAEGGTLTLRNRPEGGLDAEIFLPA